MSDSTVHSPERGENGCPRDRRQNQDTAEFTNHRDMKQRRKVDTQRLGGAKTAEKVAKSGNLSVKFLVAEPRAKEWHWEPTMQQGTLMRRQSDAVPRQTAAADTFTVPPWRKTLVQARGINGLQVQPNDRAKKTKRLDA